MVHALPGSHPGGAESKVPNEGISQSPGATWVEYERFPIPPHTRIRFQRHLPFRIHTSAVDTRPARGSRTCSLLGIQITGKRVFGVVKMVNWSINSRVHFRVTLVSLRLASPGLAAGGVYGAGECVFSSDRLTGLNIVGSEEVCGSLVRGCLEGEAVCLEGFGKSFLLLGGFSASRNSFLNIWIRGGSRSLLLRCLRCFQGVSGVRGNFGFFGSRLDYQLTAFILLGVFITICVFLWKLGRHGGPRSYKCSFLHLWNGRQSGCLGCVDLCCFCIFRRIRRPRDSRNTRNTQGAVLRAKFKLP